MKEYDRRKCPEASTGQNKENEAPGKDEASNMHVDDDEETTGEIEAGAAAYTPGAARKAISRAKKSLPYDPMKFVHVVEEVLKT